MDWYTNEIIDGLTKLMSLSLDRTPASDLVQITAATWIDATSYDRDWQQERDTPRIRGAFSTLARTSDSWPSPRKFLEALPPPTQMRLAGTGERPFDPPELRKVMQSLKPEDVITSIGDAARAIAPKTEIVTPEQRAEAEREIEQRKQRDGKALAAGDA